MVTVLRRCQLPPGAFYWSVRHRRTRAAQTGIEIELLEIRNHSSRFVRVAMMNVM
jgi:hypothetical protein